MPLLMGNRVGWHPDADLHLLQRFFVSENDLGNDFRRSAVEAVAHWLHVCEMFGDQLYKPLVIQISRGRDDHVSRRKALAVEIHHGRTLESSHGIAGPKNWPAQRMVFPKILGEDFVHEI